MRFTGIIKPGLYRLNDFVACKPGQLPIPGMTPDEPVYIHLPTRKAWSAEMVDAVFPPVPDTIIADATISVRVRTRLVFKRYGGSA